jgi:hypothetical protein
MAFYRAMWSSVMEARVHRESAARLFSVSCSVANDSVPTGSRRILRVDELVERLDGQVIQPPSLDGHIVESVTAAAAARDRL